MLIFFTLDVTNITIYNKRYCSENIFFKNLFTIILLIYALLEVKLTENVFYNSLYFYINPNCFNVLKL